MLIKYMLEELKTIRISELAKYVEGISEKPLRVALKEAGCVPAGSGKRG